MKLRQLSLESCKSIFIDINDEIEWRTRLVYYISRDITANLILRPWRPLGPD